MYAQRLNLQVYVYRMNGSQDVKCDKRINQFII